MTLTFIAAITENNVLGKDNRLLWHLPDDFKRFRQLTTGHHIVMGRKTLESMGRPLPSRTNVIITRQKDYAPAGCVVVNTIDDALSACPPDEEVFIIGGGEIFRELMEKADKLEITRVHTTIEGDAFFPDVDPAQWKLEAAVYHPKDDKHELDFTFETWVKG